MSNEEFEFDKFEAYEEQFNPIYSDRQARRKRNPKAAYKPKKLNSDIVAEVADATGIEGDFTTTYQPARHEKEWLYTSLSGFYLEELISDVLAQVKGGKEASVYRCQAHAHLPVEFVAAKVYRPRQFRNLRNDIMYREGRQTLTADGKPVKATDTRIMRALGKKSTFGVQVQHTSWLMYEYTTLDRLYRAGAAVPQPLAAGENALLMSYLGDASQAAPTLNEVSLDPAEARPLFEETLRNIELMLDHGLVHGDLSAYNILYWEGEITLIDFPQVTDFRTNPNARFILERDISRVCQYFSQQGVACDAKRIARHFWQRYLKAEEEMRELDRLTAEL